MQEQHSALSRDEIRAIGRRIDRALVLVGLMGVGKTSVGKRLAAMLDITFIDADEEIERAAQLTIPEIFALHGEQEFRGGERRVIARIMAERGKRCVLATGGGAFCDERTRSLILDKGIAVWLDSDIDTLVERTARKKNRPLLQQGDPRTVLTNLRESRREHYAQAPIHVLSSGAPQVVTAETILRKLDQWL